MSFYLSKGTLYTEQPFYAESKSHTILPSAAASAGTGSGMSSFPQHVIAVDVPNASQDIDIVINRAQFKVLDMWVVKNTVAAAGADDVTIKHVAVDGTTVTSIGLFTSITFASALGTAGSRRASVPNQLQATPTFTDRCKLRISSNSATNCGCTVFLAVGLV